MKLRYKLLTVLAVASITLPLASCDSGGNSTSPLESAAKYLYDMYKNETGAVLKDFERVSTVTYDSTSYDVTWKVTIEEGGIAKAVEVGATDNEKHATTIKVNYGETMTKKTGFDLTATVTDGSNTIDKTFKGLYVPKYLVPPTDDTKSVEDLANTPPADDSVMYYVKGIWVPTGADTDQYGNGYLYDTEGNRLTVYGMAPTIDSFTFTPTTETVGQYTFNNPKGFQELKDKFSVGDEVTLGMVYSSKYKNYYTYFKEKNRSKDASDLTYTLKTNAVDSHGTISLDKTSGKYGDKITATITPSEGYKVKTVTYNGTALAPLTATTCTFKIEPGTNIVEATFIDANTVATSFGITPENLLGWSGSNVAYPSAETEKQVAVWDDTSVTFKYNQVSCYGDGIQTRIKTAKDTPDDPAYLYNTTAFSTEIASITIKPNAKFDDLNDKGELAYKGVWSISFATSSITTKPTTFAGTFNAESGEITINCEVSGAKYFRIDHTTSGAVYVDEVIVNYKVAQ